MKVKSDDPRIMNQKKYMYGAHIERKRFEKSGNWDHEHCAFCFLKILPVDEAYCTSDGKHWMCEECYNDFKEDFHFKND